MECWRIGCGGHCSIAPILHHSAPSYCSHLPSAARPSCGRGMTCTLTTVPTCVTGADFFPAGEADVRGLERGVGGFEKSAEALRFDHSNCLLSHSCVLVESGS